MRTLLIWGEHDPFVPLRYARQMQEAIAGSRLVVLPKAGHVPMWETPAAFNETLLTFLREAEAIPHDPEARGAFGWGVAGWTEGIAHRQAGHRRDVVLVHGLGMSSAYFVRFARALYDRGFDPIAPDLPGFGESVNASPADPATHARQLAAWAERIGIRDALWIGHSTAATRSPSSRRRVAISSATSSTSRRSGRPPRDSSSACSRMPSASRSP
jgi:pimeloyl-ACP methyl ester carboxylesterase